MMPTVGLDGKTQTQMDEMGRGENHAAQLGATLLDTSTASALSRWDEVLQLQVDVFFAHELDLLYTFPRWLKANSVLDAGCGNGHYLAKLQKFFPDKTYLGIDVSPELIARATNRWQGPGLAFFAVDFFDFRPQHAFDLILMRFIVQHLKDFRAILDQAARILRPGGGILIIEPDLARSVHVPSTPIFDNLFHTFEQGRSENGHLRARLDRLSDVTAEIPNWHIEETTVSVPHVGPFAGSKLLLLYSRWIELCEQSGALEYLYQQARKEIDSWAKRDDAFSTIALRAFYLRRIEDPA